MMPLALGSIVLCVVGISAAARCTGPRSTVDPVVVVPLVAIACVLTLVPIGLAVGGGAAVAARWVWLIGALLSIPAGQVIHHAVEAVQAMAEVGSASISRIASSDHPSIHEVQSLDASLESEVQLLRSHSPDLADRR